MILLNTLPETFSNSKDTIKFRRDILTSKIVINSLKSKELELKMKGKGSTNGEWLLVGGRPTAKNNQKGGKRGKIQNRGRSQSKGKTDTITCYYCQKRIRDEKNNLKDYDSDYGEAAITTNNNNMGKVLAVSTHEYKQ